MYLRNVTLLISIAAPLLACNSSSKEEQKPRLQAAASESKATSKAGKTQEPQQPSAKPASQLKQSPAAKVTLNPELTQYVAQQLPKLQSIAPARKKQLNQLARFIEGKQKAGEDANLTFICTHNSRRSHLSQLWSAAAAAYYGVKGVHTFSGGTESTAFNPRAVAAIQRAGFKVEKGAGDNPHYQVSFSDEAQAQECFSKKYSDAANPQQNFAAIMTCSHADQNCPLVAGAVLRVSLPYVDPKASDGSPEEAATYDERTAQIATEMLYLFSQVRS